MHLLKSLNYGTKVLLGVGIIDCWRQASQTKEAAKTAEKLAGDKQIRQAIAIVEKSLKNWSSHPGFWERLICCLLLGKQLKELKQQLAYWYQQITDAEQLVAQANTLLKQDTGDPLETLILVKVIALCEQCIGIVYDSKISQKIKLYKQEIKRRQHFQKLVKDAQAQVQQRFFKQAITTYHQAEKLYPTQAVNNAIHSCTAQVKHETAYENALKQAQQGFASGKLQGAIALLESALANFPRTDGIELLEQLKCTIKGKAKYRQALQAEQEGAFERATSLYAEAQDLINSTNCQIRLGLVAIKTQDWITAISHLEGVQGHQAAYLRGFVYAQQGNFQQAHCEWISLTQATVASQRELLENLAQRQQLLAIQNIEQLVNDQNWQEAKIASVAFIDKFGHDPLVKSNLDEHIQPRLEQTLWQSYDWSDIADKSKQEWIEKPNIKTLHNWAVATYYHAQSDATQLTDAIAAISTALVNIRQDPALQDLPWLANNSIDFDSISLHLQRQLETAIDTFKDQDFDTYGKLRDRYRLEMVAVRTMGKPPKQGLRVQSDVFLTPGCYELHQHKFENSHLPAKLWATLYTPWGLSVAACLEGDTQRAIQLKPLTKSAKSSTAAESFAQKFVAYHEGCYFLQHQKWRKSVSLLKQAQSEIRLSSEFQKELDKLCETQRQAISELEEHLEFAQFWYELLGNQLAKSYLAEYKAEQVRDKLVKEQISLSQALQEFLAIKQIDAQNPVVLDLIDKTEFGIEMTEIQQLMKRKRFEEAVACAKRSQHERIRFVMAELCIDILLRGAEANQINPQLTRQLGQWAYELCPNEPAFQQLYKLLNLY
jgi:tetratricopeptide (TPR) repeat protein